MSIEKISLFLKRIYFVQIALALFFANVLLYIFLVLPHKSNIAAKQVHYGQLRKEVAKRESQIELLQTRVKRLEEARNDLEHIRTQKFISRELGVTAIRVELENLARQHQLRRENFTYKYTEVKDFNLVQFTLSVPVEGSYLNIRRFINAIERSDHFLILQRVDLSTEGQNPDQLNLNFSLSTYLVQEKI